MKIKVISLQRLKNVNEQTEYYNFIWHFSFPLVTGKMQKWNKIKYNIRNLVWIKNKSWYVTYIIFGPPTLKFYMKA